MWSYYADSHKGVCLIFDERQLESSLLKKRTGIKLMDVNYNNVLPSLEVINHDDEDSPEYVGIKSDRSFLFNKLNSWKYENEVRLVLDKDFVTFPDRTVKFDFDCLIGIIFGSRIEPDNVLTIVNLLKQRNREKEVEFYFAEKDFEKPRIKIVRKKI